MNLNSFANDFGHLSKPFVSLGQCSIAKDSDTSTLNNSLKNSTAVASVRRVILCVEDEDEDEDDDVSLGKRCMIHSQSNIPCISTLFHLKMNRVRSVIIVTMITNDSM